MRRRARLTVQNKRYPDAGLIRIHPDGDVSIDLACTDGQTGEAVRDSWRAPGASIDNASALLGLAREAAARGCYCRAALLEDWRALSLAQFADRYTSTRTTGHARQLLASLSRCWREHPIAELPLAELDAPTLAAWRVRAGVSGPPSIVRGRVAALATVLHAAAAWPLVDPALLDVLTPGESRD